MSGRREPAASRGSGKVLFPAVGVIAGLTAFVVLSALWPHGSVALRGPQAPGTASASASPLRSQSPGPPMVQNLSAAGGDSAVTVSWAAPADQQSVSYVVEAVPDDRGLKPLKCVTRKLSCSFDDLTNGVAYTVDVRIQNAVGTLSAPQRASAIPHPGILTSKSSVLWFDANDMTTVSASSAGDSPVSQWRDKSGRKNVATQSTEFSRPSLSVVGKHRALKFSGNQNMIFDGRGLPSGSTPSLIFVAARLDDPDAAKSCFDHVLAWGSDRPGAGRIIHKGCGTRGAFAETFGTYLDMKPTKPWPVGQMGVLSADITGPRIDVRMNGVRSYSWTAPSKIRTDTVPRQAAMIGGAPWAGNTTGWIGLIGEVIVLSGKIGAADRDGVERYLIRKWGPS